MTDFLSRLAAQTVYATPVLEPRRPSRHEPVTRDDQTARFEPEARWVEPVVRDVEPERIPRGPGDRESRGISDGSMGVEAGLAPKQPVDVPAAQPPTSAPRTPPRQVAAQRVIDALTGAVGAPSLTTPVPSAPRLDPDARHPVDTGLDVVRTVERDDRWSEAGSTVERGPSLAARAVPAAATGLPPEADEATMSPTEVSLPSPPLRQPPERGAVDVGRDDSMMERWQAEAIPSMGPRPVERVPAPPGPSLPEPEIVATPVNGEGRARADSPTLPETGSFTLADHPWTIPDVAGDPAGPPVVHVTIGRIEVKAAPPEPRAAEPIRAPEPVTSTLSLDDYLERRKAGWG